MYGFMLGPTRENVYSALDCPVNHKALSGTTDEDGVQLLFCYGCGNALETKAEKREALLRERVREAKQSSNEHRLEHGTSASGDFEEQAPSRRYLHVVPRNYD